MTDTRPPAQSLGAHWQRQHETSDGYVNVIARLNDRWRVIVCRDAVQFVIQWREKGTAERPWRGKHYCRTRAALIRLCGASCGRLDPGSMASLLSLPDVIGR